MKRSSEPSINKLARRERQIMEVVYQRGEATAAEVMREMQDPPSYSAVRALLRVLEEKGHLRHEERGPRYVYRPTVERDSARRSALQRLVETLFEGSAELTVAALLDISAARLSDAELERISHLIQNARKDGL